MRSCSSLPLEPFGYPATNPGPKTLMAGAEAKANLDALAWHMGRFAGYTASAINGRQILRDHRGLAPMLAEMKKRGLLFLDDGAANHSMSVQIGEVIGLPVKTAAKVIDADPPSRASNRRSPSLKAKPRRWLRHRTGTGLDVTIDAVDEWFAFASPKRAYAGSRQCCLSRKSRLVTKQKSILPIVPAWA